MSLRGFDIALGALSAQQSAIDVLNHNIANASTPGYSRQKITMVAAPPYLIPTLSGWVSRNQAGNGVEIGTIERVRDDFLDTQVRTENLHLESASVREENFNKLQTVFNEPSTTGLSQALGQFWNTWQDLSVNPSDTASRASVLQQGLALTGQIDNSYKELVSIRGELAYLASSQCSDINGIATQLAALNSEIQRSQLGGAKANDLLDRRDVLLDQLSKLVDAKVLVQPDDTVAVFVDGQDLVNRTIARQMSSYMDMNYVLHVEWTDNNIAVNPTGGKLNGTLTAANSDLTSRFADLDALAVQLRDDVNAIHRTGFDGYGNPAGDFFVGVGAMDLRMDTSIQADSRRIAAAGLPNAPGDGSLALAIGQLDHAVAKVDPASEIASGVTLAGSGVNVLRVVANGARPGAVHTFTSTAPGTITLSTTIAGSTLTQTLPLADMAAGDVQTLDFPGLGIRVTLQSSGGPATAAAIIADLTSGAQNDLTVANRNSVEDTYQKLVVNLGVDARGAKNDRINSEALANNLEQRRQSVSSVSLDEEAARLQEHLRAYQAAARVITTFDDMLDHLINNMGTVGR